MKALIAVLIVANVVGAVVIHQENKISQLEKRLSVCENLVKKVYVALGGKKE